MSMLLHEQISEIRQRGQHGYRLCSMMKRYSEFSQKVDAIDENSLSSEDSAYYTEVMTRCTQKLASVGQ